MPFDVIHIFPALLTYATCCCDQRNCNFIPTASKLFARPCTSVLAAVHQVQSRSLSECQGKVLLERLVHALTFTPQSDVSWPFFNNLTSKSNKCFWISTRSSLILLFNSNFCRELRFGLQSYKHSLPVPLSSKVYFRNVIVLTLLL